MPDTYIYIKRGDQYFTLARSTTSNVVSSAIPDIPSFSLQRNGFVYRQDRDGDAQVSAATSRETPLVPGEERLVLPAIPQLRSPAYLGNLRQGQDLEIEDINKQMEVNLSGTSAGLVIKGRSGRVSNARLTRLGVALPSGKYEYKLLVRAAPDANAFARDPALVASIESGARFKLELTP
jgi:hypothetical protein